MTTNHPDPTPPPAEPAPSLRPVEEIVPRDVEEIATLVRRVQSLPTAAAELVAREFVAARLAAADRENAELRGEVERLTRERDAYRKAKSENDERFMLERDEARAHLAAAQAQLAEVRAVLFRVRRGTSGRKIIERDEEAEIVAALSAAPQPEPEYRCAECQGEITPASDLISVNVDGHAKAAHRDCSAPHHYSRGYPISHAEHAWDNPAPERAYLLVDPEPPASDEPARCGPCALCLGDGNCVSCTDCPERPRTPDPECRHCGGSGNAHTFDGDELGICGTCHGTGSAPGGGR